jgi:hypothetical protein
VPSFLTYILPVPGSISAPQNEHILSSTIGIASSA